MGLVGLDDLRGLDWLRRVFGHIVTVGVIVVVKADLLRLA